MERFLSNDLSQTEKIVAAKKLLKIQQKDVANPQRVVFAALNLVDLAGSERASKTEATGARLKEGAFQS